MNKEQFIAALRARLTGLQQTDLERTLQYYREMIDDRIEDGMTEIEAVADVGDPAELAEAILQKPVKQTAVRVTKAPKERKPMSRGVRAVLGAVAGLLIVAGVGLILASLNAGSRELAEKEYTFANAGIRALEIDSDSAELKLIPASDGICRVVCTEGAGRSHKVWTNEGTLHVERSSRWSLFRFSVSKDYIHIYLPGREYESLWVESSSGGVGVPDDFRFRTAIITVSSGGVGFAADVTEELNIQASSGGVAVSDASPDTLNVKASSGGVALADMNPGTVSVHLSSGGLKLENVRCKSLSAESSSGGMRLSNVIADGTVRLECSSGSIRLDDCDAAELYIECTSGAVSGHLLTPKTYSASATSGSVRVPTGSGGGLCVVKTTSGSIRFD